MPTISQVWTEKVITSRLPLASSTSGWMGPDQESTAAMGAKAYATGNHVVFGDNPDLHTVAHEVAHRVHMDHSKRFHALVAELLGADPAPARRWLRANAGTVQGFGRAA